MGYVTFGLVTLTFVTVTVRLAKASVDAETPRRRQRSASGTPLTPCQAIATYILLYLDQEVLSELTNVRPILKASRC